MESTRINQYKHYLENLETPTNLSAKEKKKFVKEAPKYTVYKDVLYRYNTENGIIRKVLNKEEAEEITVGGLIVPVFHYFRFASYQGRQYGAY